MSILSLLLLKGLTLEMLSVFPLLGISLNPRCLTFYTEGVEVGIYGQKNLFW